MIIIKLVYKKVKVVHTRLPSIGFRSWFRFLAVSQDWLTWVINPPVGCHYFPPGRQLPSQPLTGLLPVSLLGEHRGTMGVNSLPKTLTRQHRSCDLNPGPTVPRVTLPSVLWRCCLGGMKDIWTVKNWVLGCWHGYLSGVRYRLFAFGPADATAIPKPHHRLSEIQTTFTFLVPA